MASEKFFNRVVTAELTRNKKNKRYVAHVKGWTFFLMALCLFGCYGFPEAISLKFGLSVPSFSNRLPYIAPFLFVFIWVVASCDSFGTKTVFRISWPEALFILNASFWLGIEVVHSFNGSSIPIFEFIVPQIWLFLFYYVFREYALRNKYCRELGWLFLLAPFCFCLMQFFMYLHIIPGEPIPLKLIQEGHRPNGFHLNYSSYVALTGIWILLFANRTLYGQISKKLFIPLLMFFTTIIIINQTRGALLFLFIIFLVKILLMLPKWSTQTVLIFCVGVGISVASYFYIQESLLAKIMLIEDDSTRIRLLGLIIAPLYQSNYLFGLGAAASLDVTFEGFQSHSYFMRVYLAYGILGVATLALAMVSMFVQKSGRLGVLGLTGLGLLLLHMTVEPDLLWYYALFPVIASTGAISQPDAGNLK